MADLLPLRARLGVLGGVRALLAVVTVLAPPLAGTPSSGRAAAFAAATALAASALVLDVARRARRRVPPWAVGASLLVDGVCLVAALAVTGGPNGPLTLLVPAHLVAVTLLASYRTGLKLAMWYSLLLPVAQQLTDAGMLGAEVGAAPREAAVAAVVMYWVVALVTAVCSAVNERELRRSRGGFRALAEMASRLEQVDGPGEVLDVLLDAVVHHTGFRRAAVLTRSGDDGVDARVRPSGQPASTATWGQLARPASAVRRCVQGRAPLLVAALHAEEDVVLAGLLPDARNLVLVPLSTDEGPLGVLVVERGGRPPARVPASLVHLVSEFAAHAGLAHRNATLVERMRHLAAADGLTGLANRRAFDEALHAEVQRAARTGEPLSLVLLDIDHFKAVNDAHGHQVGDDVLRQVARALAGGRATDLPARYGGEEFAVLLPACAGPDAVAVAERLRARIADGGGPVGVTASAGVASLPANARDASTLVDAADAALYQAKRRGRNRAVLAATPEHRPGGGRAGPAASTGDGRPHLAGVGAGERRPRRPAPT